jgi:hypothetical protein
VLGLLLGLMFTVLNSSGWAVMAAMLCFGGFILSYYAPAYPELIWVWLGNLVVMVLRHWKELRQVPGIREDLIKVFRKK